MSDNAVVIRDTEPADREAIREVLLDAYGQYEQVLPEEAWSRYKESILEAIDGAATKARLAAVLNGEVVGSVFLFDSSEAAYGLPDLNIQTPIIRLLAVSRKARGYGIATELIRASAKLATEWGAETLHLHTSDMMDSAVRLYERLGFERAFDKDLQNGDTLVKSYRLALKETSLLQVQ
ncbi:GNAT superfamily N-acetyltransferase [Paenibacillus endophyticus]|uniref:GNAT superfamily N-acetyltransferase n=1 Tax=Paenibacillus endophyticus TaxID=1294268 RepID=A0A7W5C4H0_9BACL|nr:GNAT family N-acetyltransferase [Paenibacillus endophyticus]MBB3151036.1 GNAT superfamily N-acetyltransferase [Paenibacillus endophyticus]